MKTNYSSWIVEHLKKFVSTYKDYWPDCNNLTFSYYADVNGMKFAYKKQLYLKDFVIEKWYFKFIFKPLKEETYKDGYLIDELYNDETFTLEFKLNNKKKEWFIFINNLNIIDLLKKQIEQSLEEDKWLEEKRNELNELQEKIQHYKNLEKESGLDYSSEIKTLEEKIKELETIIKDYISEINEEINEKDEKMLLDIDIIIQDSSIYTNIKTISKKFEDDKYWKPYYDYKLAITYIMVLWWWAYYRVLNDDVNFKLKQEIIIKRDLDTEYIYNKDKEKLLKEAEKYLLERIKKEYNISVNNYESITYYDKVDDVTLDILLFKTDTRILVLKEGTYGSIYSKFDLDLSDLINSEIYTEAKWLIKQKITDLYKKIKWKEIIDKILFDDTYKEELKNKIINELKQAFKKIIIWKRKAFVDTLYKDYYKNLTTWIYLVSFDFEKINDKYLKLSLKINIKNKTLDLNINPIKLKDELKNKWISYFYNLFKEIYIEEIKTFLNNIKKELEVKIQTNEQSVLKNIFNNNLKSFNLEKIVNKVVDKFYKKIYK